MCHYCHEFAEKSSKIVPLGALNAFGPKGFSSGSSTRVPRSKPLNRPVEAVDFDLKLQGWLAG